MTEVSQQCFDELVESTSPWVAALQDDLEVLPADERRRASIALITALELDSLDDQVQALTPWPDISRVTRLWLAALAQTFICRAVDARDTPFSLPGALH